MEEQTHPQRGTDAPLANRAISIEVNGEPHTVGVDASVRALLDELGLGGTRVAVAVDRKIVPRSRYDEVTLAAGDRVEILEAVGGG